MKKNGHRKLGLKFSTFCNSCKWKNCENCIDIDDFDQNDQNNFENTEGLDSPILEPIITIDKTSDVTMRNYNEDAERSYQPSTNWKLHKELQNELHGVAMELQMSCNGVAKSCKEL